MYEYQADNLTIEIHQKIKLFTNEKYFNLFSYILTKKSHNFSAFKKLSSLALSIDKLIEEKEKKQKKLLNQNIPEKEPKISPWFYIMMHICNLPNKKKYIKPKKNELNLDHIIYSYMASFCHKKIKLLYNFSIQHKLEFNNLVKFYLDLCTNEIALKKEKLNKKETKEDNISEANYNGNKDFYRRKSRNKPNLKEIRNNFNSDTKKKLTLKLPKKRPQPQLKLSELFGKKSKKDGKTIEYSNSFTRLFIGDTDIKSVKERYLSNIVIKKVKELHLFNTNIDLSSLYLKKLYHKLFKNEVGTDNEMKIILNKFKLDSKIVQNYQKSALSFDKGDSNKHYIDEEKVQMEKKLQNQINIYSKPISMISKFSLSPKNNMNKLYKKLNMNREKFNMGIREMKNKSKSLLVNLSDYNNQYYLKNSRNTSSNFNSIKLSMNNNSRSISTINTKLSKNKIKINFKYSPVDKQKLSFKNDSINKNNDDDNDHKNNIFINIRTNLNKGEDYIKINNKRLVFKSTLNKEDFFYANI